jgi:hypothetical protein
VVDIHITEEITVAARAPYGPISGAPNPQQMGDKALWVDPADNQKLYQVQSGNWVPIAVCSSALVKLEQIVAGSGGLASFDFTNIDQRYSALRLVVYAISDHTGAPNHVNATFNGDTGANYLLSQIYDGGGGEYTAQTAILVTDATGTDATYPLLPNSSVVEIPGYADMHLMKTGSIQWASYSDVASDLVVPQSFAWLSTAAITRITLTPASGNLAQYSKAVLYGIL